MGLPLVIEATGSPQAVEDSIRIVSPAGRIVILGLTNKSVKIFPRELIRKELATCILRLLSKLQAGKTTLISLIPRFYDVTKGFIAIGGYDIRKLKLS